MQNYKLMLNSCSELSSILDHSKSAEDKENLPDKPLIANTLEKLIKEIWKGDVERVRNGARGKQTVKFLHLARKTAVPFCPTLSFCDVEVPDGWSALRCNNDEKSNCYVRPESRYVNNHRAITEVHVEHQSERLKFTLVANGCKVALNDFGTDTEKHQIENVLKLTNESNLCQGYRLETEERILAMLPHHLEHISRMSEQDSNSVSETVAYSDECSIILSNDNGKVRCASCKNLVNTHRRRTKRIQNRQSIHPYCNKRFVDKKEIEQQLQEYRKDKQNCMRREEYWRGKFIQNTIELDSKDNVDLQTIFNSMGGGSVPEDMEVLWEQQRKIIGTSSHCGNRWHPK